MYLRVVDQLVGCGTSVGANIFEANEAMSTKDWLKCMGIAAKELAETRFWLKRIEKQAWITPTRLKPLQTECDSLQKVIGAMVVATKRKSKAKNRSA
ncbi:MAG: four helix bundle protein [Phycisphaerales bacterium]